MSLTRRRLVALAPAVCVAAMPLSRAFAQDEEALYFAGTATDGGYVYRRTNMAQIDPVWRKQLVNYVHSEHPGTIVVDTRAHFLYVCFENNTALRYGCGVGKEGFKWYGRAQVQRKSVWPGWTPPPEMLARRPELPRHMIGGPENPLGPRAMYLYRDGRDLDYRLHGTVEPWSIGSDVSSGCIRLLPEHVMDLFQRTPIGTKVLVLERLPTA